MKLAAIIFSSVLAVSLTAFIVYVLVYGTEEGAEIGGGPGESFSQNFGADDISDIEINLVVAETKIGISKSNEITVDYDGVRKGSKLTAALNGNKLVIEETTMNNFSFFNFGIFNKGKSNLRINLPEKQYEKIALNMISGNVDIENILSEYLSINTTSGSVNAKAFSDELRLSTISGDIKIKNNTDKTAGFVLCDSTSGDITADGYRPKSFNISTISGKTVMFGASGEGMVNITSGDVEIYYTDWNGDLDISSISGDVNLTLPKNSGLNLDLSRISGSVYADLNDKAEKLKKSGEYVLGGSNKHNVEINLTSGKVRIEEKSGSGETTEIIMTAFEEAGAGAYGDISTVTGIEEIYEINTQ